jgi:hypothetical protein
MDPNQIVSIVIQILLPKVLDGGLEHIGSGMAQALYEMLRKRFQKTPNAQKALENLKATPSDVNIQELFRDQLVSILESDQAFATNLLLVSEILQLAMKAERLEASSKRRPGRFLCRVVDEISKKLNDAEVFQSKQYVTIDDEPGFTRAADEDGYREKNIHRKLPVPTVAEAFGLNSEDLALIQTTTNWDRVTDPINQIFLISSLLKLFSNKGKKQVVTYSLEYKRRPIFPDGEEYHIVFSEVMARTRWEVDASRGRKQNDKPEYPEDQIHTINAEILAKFLWAILDDYIIYMRPQVTIDHIVKSWSDSPY